MLKFFMKSIISIVVLSAMIVVLNSEAKAEKTVGVIIFSKENHYAETWKGIMGHLQKEGLTEPKVKYLIENAEGDKVKTSKIVSKFSESKVDMIIALGTTPAVFATRETKNIPIVFSMVYDPVESQIAQGWNSSGNNAAGSSNKFSMSHILKTLNSFASVKRLGVLYQPGEKNSEAQLRELQSEKNNFKINIIPIPVTRKEDVSNILSDAVKLVDALYLAGSSILGETVSTTVDIATKAKVITMSNLEERVEKGVMIGVCADSYKVGQLAGERAAKILKGAKPSSLSIGVVKKTDIIINMKTAQAAQIQVSDAFLKTATKIIK
jgi:putative ABC transport system substrate-binding protein